MQVHAGHSRHSGHRAIRRFHVHAGEPSVARASRQVRRHTTPTSRNVSPNVIVPSCRQEEARRVLQRVRGLDHHIDDELEAIKASTEESERELKVY